jgi:hypothetical protein
MQRTNTQSLALEEALPLGMGARRHISLCCCKLAGNPRVELALERILAWWQAVAVCGVHEVQLRGPCRPS